VVPTCSWWRREAQIVQAFENLKRMLETAGASMEDIVDLTTFHTDMRDLPLFIKVRNRYLTATRCRLDRHRRPHAGRGAWLHHRDQGGGASAQEGTGLTAGSPQENAGRNKHKNT
jgi:hypothetical protein